MPDAEHALAADAGLRRAPRRRGATAASSASSRAAGRRRPPVLRSASTVCGEVGDGDAQRVVAEVDADDRDAGRAVQREQDAGAARRGRRRATRPRARRRARRLQLADDARDGRARQPGLARDLRAAGEAALASASMTRRRLCARSEPSDPDVLLSIPGQPSPNWGVFVKSPAKRSSDSVRRFARSPDEPVFAQSSKERMMRALSPFALSARGCTRQLEHPAAVARRHLARRASGPRAGRGRARRRTPSPRGS